MKQNISEQYIRKVIKEEINKAVSKLREPLMEANNNLTFRELKSDMKKLGFRIENAGRGSATKFILDYNGKSPMVLVDAHNDNAQVKADTLREVWGLLRRIGWFKDERNLRIFPFDRWGFKKKDAISTNDTATEIENANIKYKDAKVEPVFQDKGSVCAIVTSQGANLCRSIQDRRPLLQTWFDRYEYDKKRGIPCLKRDNYETMETECFPIKKDGTLDTQNVIIENKKYGKNRQRV